MHDVPFRVKDELAVKVETTYFRSSWLAMMKIHYTSLLLGEARLIS